VVKSYAETVPYHMLFPTSCNINHACIQASMQTYNEERSGSTYLQYGSTTQMITGVCYCLSHSQSETTWLHSFFCKSIHFS